MALNKILHDEQIAMMRHSSATAPADINASIAARSTGSPGRSRGSLYPHRPYLASAKRGPPMARRAGSLDRSPHDPVIHDLRGAPPSASVRSTSRCRPAPMTSIPRKRSSRAMSGPCYRRVATMIHVLQQRHGAGLDGRSQGARERRTLRRCRERSDWADAERLGLSDWTQPRPTSTPSTMNTASIFASEGGAACHVTK